MAKLLYIGPDGGTSRHRYHALQRLGHEVRQIDPFAAIAYAPLLMTWGFKSGYFGLERRIERYVLDQVGGDCFDIVWIDNGEQIGRDLVRKLKIHAHFILNHNLDNPFTARDGKRWRLFKGALPEYDLFATPRATTAKAAIANGAKRTLTVMFSADEEIHRRAALDEAEQRRFRSEVAFVGTWMPERGPFAKGLLERGVPLRIFGPRWEKAREFDGIRAAIDARRLDDKDYVRAVSGAKIALGLLSHGNEDLHTTRSLEIPAIGSLLCAPRTIDHEKLYSDGEEAIFFSSVQDCAEKCLALLADDERRRAISEAGQRRALRNNWFNQRLCADILAALPNERSWP